MAHNADLIAVQPARREFLRRAAVAMGAVGLGAVTWPLIDSLNPAADAIASHIATQWRYIDLSGLGVGERITVVWSDTPVFIARRTQQEITDARNVSWTDLPDPEDDRRRVRREDLLVVVGVCTRGECVTKGQRPDDLRGRWGGWFCPCCGSHYDTSGRVRYGPAKTNLHVPLYALHEERWLKIGWRLEFQNS
jgi:ubiquinol-cytochrome c reductase iron-sulfur subunit